MNDKEIKERLQIALLKFVENAAKTSATPEEVEALPKVASVLAGLLVNPL
ncbi:hypothetical protein [Clostridium sp. D33t1_170424_F3]|nr:hypothetical protein [Clostridium sp. D33t1_170424_F3]